MPQPPNRPITRPRKATDEEVEERTLNIETEAALQYKDIQDINCDITRINHALWGQNGDIGMVGRLSKVEDVISDIKKLLWAIFTLVLAIAIGGVWQAMEHAIGTGNMP